MIQGLPKDRIVVEGLELTCVVGVYEQERVMPQRLVVDVELTVDTEPAASGERLELTVDYEWVTWQIAFLLKLGRFQLLETAAHAIGRTLLLPPLSGEHRCPIDAVELCLRKPDALGGRGRPSLRYARAAGELTYRQETGLLGPADLVFETPELALYRFNVGPGQRLERRGRPKTREAELLLSDGLVCHGERCPRGSVRLGPSARPRRYDNETEQVESILCLDRLPLASEREPASEVEPDCVTLRSPFEL